MEAESAGAAWRASVKGFVRTPPETVDEMVDLLFRARRPAADSTVLDPGCGTGEFVEGIIRWCSRHSVTIPHITGIELDPRHLPALHEKFGRHARVRIERADFLAAGRTAYDYIVGNPPYVPITALSEAEKPRYRAGFATARGRFDLYLLFFEQALRQLAPGGRLVFITPEKYLYVDTAGPLRELLARCQVEEIRLVREDTFGDLVTYPTITVVVHEPPRGTRVVRRDGTTLAVKLPSGRSSWLPVIEGGGSADAAVTLGDLCLRLSCGVATGADDVFVLSAADLEPGLRPFAHPTIAGRELTPTTRELAPRFAMLTPYDATGRLLPLDNLGGFARYLLRDDVRQRLLARTCAARKPWYAFHETPALHEILRPKILCKDIGNTPRFWVDRHGEIVPRHSVYYIVPQEPGAIDATVDYLRSPEAQAWLWRNCQRASNGFLRLQSRVLQRLPVPEHLTPVAAGACRIARGDAKRLQA
jgi:SAM-dependent methyltransferase